MAQPTPTNDEMVAWRRRLLRVVHSTFSLIPEDDRQDLVQEAVAAGLSRGVLGGPPSWKQSRRLLLDAYRALYKSRRAQTEILSDGGSDAFGASTPPNQLADMEVRDEAQDKTLSVEELEFQELLISERRRGVNFVRERETRHALGSLPLSLGDCMRLLAASC